MTVLNKPAHEYTIFVALTAYNDRYIKQTVDSAFERAKYPDRIRFGISEQRIDTKFCIMPYDKRVKKIQSTYAAPLGLGMSRNLTLALYADEDFVFQIDAHMIFAQDWDEKLIQGYLAVYNDMQDDKIVLTCHPPWWNKNDDGSYYFTPAPEDLIPTVNYKPEPYIVSTTIEAITQMKQKPSVFGMFLAQTPNHEYEVFIKDWRGVRYQTFNTEQEARTWVVRGFNDGNFYPKYGGALSKPQNGKNYLEHYLFVAHYVFSTYSFFRDIILDPLIQWGGEEPTMAMRGWTRGYRFFGIAGHILWHFNKNKNDDPEDRLANPGDPALLAHQSYKTKNALERVKKILSGEILGYWGAPTSELLQAYEEAVDFDFKKFYKDVEEQDKFFTNLKR